MSAVTYASAKVFDRVVTDHVKARVHVSYEARRPNQQWSIVVVEDGGAAPTVLNYWTGNIALAAFLGLCDSFINQGDSVVRQFGPLAQDEHGIVTDEAS